MMPLLACLCDLRVPVRCELRVPQHLYVKETREQRTAASQPACKGTRHVKGAEGQYGPIQCKYMGGGVKSTNFVKITIHPRFVSYNSKANVRIVKIVKPRR
jgi:hypothetical protein